MPDDGLADPRLEAALSAGSAAQLAAVLAGARVFAAVRAVATSAEVTATGLRAESTAQMAVLLLEADGARALPVFTSVPALLRWRPDARPVPLSGPDACRAALEEGAEALVLDPPDPGREVPVDQLEALAGGWVPVVGSQLASRRVQVALEAPRHEVSPELLRALCRALAGERLRAARLLQGPEGLVLGVSSRRALDPVALAALAHRVLARLGDTAPPEGLDLAQVPLRGPGVRLRVGRLRRVR